LWANPVRGLYASDTGLSQTKSKGGGLTRPGTSEKFKILPPQKGNRNPPNKTNKTRNERVCKEKHRFKEGLKEKKINPPGGSGGNAKDGTESKNIRNLLT